MDRLERNSTSSPDQLSITLRAVEEGAVNLRWVGEALAILKGRWILVVGLQLCIYCYTILLVC